MATPLLALHGDWCEYGGLTQARMQEEEEAPAFVIKKRTKPRSSLVSKLSTSSDSTSAPLPTASALEGEEDDGNVPVIRSRGKKTPAGRVKARESGAAAARGKISFGGGDDGDEAGVSRPVVSTRREEEARLMYTCSGRAPQDDSETSFVVKRSSNASSSTPRRLLRPSAAIASSTASPSLASSSAAGAPFALGSSAKTESSAVAAAAGSIYSKEYLDELKRSQLKAPKPSSEEETAAPSPAGYDSLTRSKFGAEQLQGGSARAQLSAAPRGSKLASLRE